MQMLLAGALIPFNFNLTSGTDVNLRTRAISAGWDGSSPLVATIPNGNTLQASSTGVYACSVSGAFPNGVKLINNGVIIGRGGDGGAGGAVAAGSAGYSAGPALFVNNTISIDNANGRISAGGGGGRGGAGSGGKNPLRGGGGGGGIGISIGGASGGTPAGSGVAGTLTAAGAGGGGSGGAGGAGGTYGTASSGNTNNYLNGSAFVNWIAFGLRNGTFV